MPRLLCWDYSYYKEGRPMLECLLGEYLFKPHLHIPLGSYFNDC